MRGGQPQQGTSLMFKCVKKYQKFEIKKYKVTPTKNGNGNKVNGTLLIIGMNHQLSSAISKQSVFWPSSFSLLPSLRLLVVILPGLQCEPNDLKSFTE